MEKGKVMRRVLLTGGGGFIGAHTLAHIMHMTNWELVIIDSFRHKGKTDRISEMFRAHPDWKERCTIITHDLRAPFSRQTMITLGKIDYVINMASESHVDRSISDPRDFIENNVSLTLTMLEYMRSYNSAMQEKGIKKFIQISTDEVYGSAPDGHNHKEGEPHMPSNPYSASKAAQESIAYSYWRTYDLPICITNTMNIIGEMQDGEKYLPMIVKSVLSGEPLTIHASPDKKRIGSRYYLHARNQADALIWLLDNIDFPTYSSGKEIARYNIVGEQELTNLELAQKVAGILGKELKYELVDFHSSRPGHDLRYALDGTKLAEAGWKAPLSLDESLASTVKWMAERKEWL